MVPELFLKMPLKAYTSMSTILPIRHGQLEFLSFSKLD